MIHSVLSRCWKHDVVLMVNEVGSLQADYSNGSLPDDLRIQIKQHKLLLIERIQQNQKLRSEGWFIGQLGDVYEYRIGHKSYLYIERESEETFTLFRRTERDFGEDKYKVMSESASFVEVHEKAMSYATWWKRTFERR